jgi:hypothetical protein
MAVVLPFALGGTPNSHIVADGAYADPRGIAPFLRRSQ